MPIAGTVSMQCPWIVRRLTFVTTLAATILVSLSASGADASPTAFTDILQPTLEQSCVKCHGKNGKVKGKVNLLELKSAADLTKNPELIRKLIEALDLKEMPPEDEPALPAEKRTQLVATLKDLLHAAIATQTSSPRSPIRRMNRFQYNNAVQDLFNLKVEVFALPERMLREHGNYFNPVSGKMPDSLKAGSRPLGKSQLIDKRRLAGVAPFPQDLRAEHGFDNRADHLSLSPLLLESLLQLSDSIVESEDFNSRHCGIWKEFFDPPAKAEEIEPVVRRRLQAFLTRAFRRPVEKPLLDRYTAHVLGRIRSGESFTQSMKAAAAAALASPRFLYLYDLAGASNRAEQVDDFELASRLSFFLWGSIPDQPLLDAAAEGKLSNPKSLATQVDRMLNDHRMKRFCDSFPSQWLQLERIIASVPDPELHPNFYFAKFRASMHMMLEPLLLFETILVEDRSILELIDSDFSYRSDLLSEWYKKGGGGKTTPTAIPFQRVPVTDRRQGGVITTAAVMTMTSNPTRTQPITRGAWIASVIFNDPPEPPPADVPPLTEDEDSAEVKNMTLRERLDAHRTRPDCAGCHAKIDPFGFALENYGPTGIWRDKYENGRDVDMSGSLFRTHKFTNIVEFKGAILAEKERFARAFAGHLLAFALGRELSASDSPALDQIVSKTAAESFRLRAMLKQIVLSEPFRHKSNPVPPSDKQPKHAQ
jgi:mono/diheme cytochrome c family protein